MTFQEKSARFPADAQILGTGEREHLECTFAVKLLPKNAVDMRENQIDGFLRERIERSAAGNDGAEHRVVVFDVQLLVRLVRIAEKQSRFPAACEVIFEGGVAEFSAVIREQNGENITKSDTVFCKFLLQRGNLRGRLHGRFVFQEQPEHEVKAHDPRERIHGMSLLHTSLTEVEQFAGAVRERRFTALHTIPNKLTGLMVFFVPFALRTSWAVGYCAAACIVAAVAALHEMSLHLCAPQRAVEREAQAE